MRDRFSVSLDQLGDEAVGLGDALVLPSTAQTAVSKASHPRGARSPGRNRNRRSNPGALAKAEATSAGSASRSNMRRTARAAWPKSAKSPPRTCSRSFRAGPHAHAQMPGLAGPESEEALVGAFGKGLDAVDGMRTIIVQGRVPIEGRAEG